MDGRILVVDDDADILLLLRVALGEQGWDVYTVGSGAEAVERLAREDFDLVLSDLHMPGTDGMGVLAAVREHAPDTLAVVVTSDAQVEAAVGSLRAGAHHFVTKPLDLEEVRAVVRKALETRRLRQAASLYRATRAVLTTLDARELPGVIVGVALDVMQAAHAAILVEGDEGWEVRHRASAAGAEEDLPAEVYLRVAERVGLDREPLLLPADAPRAPALPPRLSLVAHPLVSRDLDRGVLVVRRGPEGRLFGRGDVRRVALLAAQASLALDNAELFEQLRARVGDLERARRRLTSSERMEGLARFATSVAHELQAPTSYLLTHLRALRESVDGEARERLDYALQGAERIALLAGDLSRLSRSRDDVELPVDQAVAAALRMAGGRVREDVVTDLHGATVRGNPGQLSVAIINLLVNAEQALAGRPGEPIEVRSRSRDQRVFLEVADRGPGIPEELLDRVTEPFFTTRDGESTGLGLAVVQEIAESHGGELRLAAREGGGTVATLVLPAVAEVEVLAMGAFEE